MHLSISPMLRPAARHFSSSCRQSRNLLLAPFKEGDFVLVKPQKQSDDRKKLVGPLRPGSEFNFGRGPIDHEKLIGKLPRDAVLDRIGSSYTLHHPTLEEYALFTPRSVTPLYTDAVSMIMSLLDITVFPYNKESVSGDVYRILEAGTGHGALTIHLARAIQAANPPREPNDDIESWKQKRLAIVDTLEPMKGRSDAASRRLLEYLDGVYHPHVDFHPQSVDEHLDGRSDPFLNAAVLDLPDLTEAVERVAPLLYPDGKLVAFAPSITQIAECVTSVRRLNLPIVMDRVLETNIWKEWAVDSVLPRSSGLTFKDAKESDFKLVCRPKFGQVTAGGFVALWRKKRFTKPTNSLEVPKIPEL